MSFLSASCTRAAPLEGAKCAGAVDGIWKFLVFNDKSLQIQSHYSDLYLEALQFPLSPSLGETEFREAAFSQGKDPAVASLPIARAVEFFKQP